MKIMRLNPYYLYQVLKKQFGDQKWWPIDKDYHNINNSNYKSEIIFGSILTQNTSWNNVEKSLINLKKYKKLSINDIYNIDKKFLENLIKPSGFYKQKSNTLKNICNFIINNYNNKLDNFFNRKLIDIRRDLLSIKGIGSETADAILLYAGDKPIFVVDKYTKRLCRRISFEVEINYSEIQTYFQNNLKNYLLNDNIVNAYKEYHALIVELCKKNCKINPYCENCVVRKYCNFKEYYISKP